MAKKLLTLDHLSVIWATIVNSLTKKQDKLVSGQNLSTINGNSLLTGNNITIKEFTGASLWKVAATTNTVDSTEEAKVTAFVTTENGYNTLQLSFDIPKGKDGTPGGGGGNNGKDGTKWEIRDGYWWYTNSDGTWVNSNVTVKMTFDELVNVLGKASSTKYGLVKINPEQFAIDDDGVLNLVNPSEGGGDTNIYYSATKTVFVYLITSNNYLTAPATPTNSSSYNSDSGVITLSQPSSLQGEDKWQLDFNTSDTKGKKVWMAAGNLKMYGSYTFDYWTTPMLIGGDGYIGTDGQFVDFIYKRAKSNETVDHVPSSIKAPLQLEDEYSEGALEGWTDNPQGVDSEYTREFVSTAIRTGTDDDGNAIWSEWAPPALWAKWGEDGVDGDGVQYIFKRTENYYDDNSRAGLLNIGKLSEQYLTDLTHEYIPTGWTDNPSGVTPTYKYEWVSKRKFRKQSDGVKRWNNFSTPALWASYAETPQFKTELVTLYAPDNDFIESNGTNDGSMTAVIEALKNRTGDDLKKENLIPWLKSSSIVAGAYLHFYDWSSLPEHKGLWKLSLQFSLQNGSMICINSANPDITYIGGSEVTVINNKEPDSYTKIRLSDYNLSIPTNLEGKVVSDYHYELTVELIRGTEAVSIKPEDVKITGRLNNWMSFSKVSDNTISLIGSTTGDKTSPYTKLGYNINILEDDDTVIEDAGYSTIEITVTENGENKYYSAKVQHNAVKSAEGTVFYSLQMPEVQYYSAENNDNGYPDEAVKVPITAYKYTDSSRTELNVSNASSGVSLRLSSLASPNSTSSYDFVVPFGTNTNGNTDVRWEAATVVPTLSFGTGAFDSAENRWIIETTSGFYTYVKLVADNQVVDVVQLHFIRAAQDGEPGTDGKDGWTPKTLYVASYSNTSLTKSPGGTAYSVYSTPAQLRSYGFTLSDSPINNPDVALFACNYYVDSKGNLIKNSQIVKNGSLTIKSDYSAWYLVGGKLESAGTGGTGLTGVPGINYDLTYIIGMRSLYPTVGEIGDSYKSYVTQGKNTQPNNAQLTFSTGIGGETTDYTVVFYNTYNDADNALKNFDNKYDLVIYTIQGKVSYKKQDQADVIDTISDISIIPAPKLDSNILQSRVPYIAYYAGMWSASESYSVSAGDNGKYKVPYVLYNNSYYLYNYAIATNPSDNQPPTTATEKWTLIPMSEVAYSKLSLIGRGQINNLCFYGDWMFSSEGKSVPKSSSDSKTYTYEDFDLGAEEYPSTGFIPNYAVNVKTGAVYMAGGKVSVSSDGQLVIGKFGNVITADQFGNVKVSNIVAESIEFSGLQDFNSKDKLAILPDPEDGRYFQYVYDISNGILTKGVKVYYAQIYTVPIPDYSLQRQKGTIYLAFGDLPIESSPTVKLKKNETSSYKNVEVKPVQGRDTSHNNSVDELIPMIKLGTFPGTTDDTIFDIASGDVVDFNKEVIVDLKVTMVPKINRTNFEGNTYISRGDYTVYIDVLSCEIRNKNN